ncbi:CDP-alcohol phosphatidyltransferase family protein [Anaerocolumna sp. AGMB13020]|uniref:CDP-alcohol phosphatidyltransferase family protein n=1 Tax=Anaerocolumna sp. AGMB13020 TaxID=3081750 RepID=UPI002952B3E1|nr:CDP-alcohol phosphatidyltransferase family protein [Anaerocolumna sp. AGMB13020]WOO37916.1 CDP-alcohol phosphatidyltransferase family protein [Anaerocolumna sp. AGMB13020]
MKLLPNAISFSRIALSLLMLLITPASALFLIIYLLCGLSDIADGYIARHYRMQTNFGAKLDSLADFIFWIIVFYILIFRTNFAIDLFILSISLIVAAVRLINFIITRNKFKQWAMMHTLGNKLTGLVLFLVFPLWVYFGVVPYVLAIIPLLSSLEEGIILLTTESYDVNRKSIYQSKENADIIRNLK